MEAIVSSPLFWAGIAVAVGGGIIRGLMKYSEWRGKMDEFKNGVGPILTEIRGDIKKIFRRLPGAPVTSGSTVRLTELGVELAAKLGARQWASSIAPALLSAITDMNAYQVQEFCSQYVGDETFESAPGMLDKIQNLAFEHGLVETQVRDVLMVELRDQLLEMNTT